MPTLLTTAIPPEYIGEATVSLPIASHRLDIQLRFTVFGELLEYQSPVLELPSEALQLTFSAEGLKHLRSELDYLPYRLILMVFGKRKRYLKNDTWKPVKVKLTKLRKRKQINKLNVPATHEIVKDICDFQLPENEVAKMLEVYTVIHLVETTNDDETRNDAIVKLGHLGKPQAIEPLSRVTKESISQNVIDAVAALGNIGDTRAAVPLLEALQHHNAYISFVAMESIVRLRDHKQIPHLQTLLNHRTSHVKLNAALALYCLGEKNVTQILIDALSIKPTRSYYAILEALGNNEERQAVEPLIAILNNEGTNNHIRHHIAMALGNIGDDRAVESLLIALKDKDVGLRNKAAEALGKIKGANLSNDLIEALHDSLRAGCLQAALVLASIGDTRATPQLIKSLKAKNEDGFKIIEALGKLGDAGAVMPMIAALKHKNYMTKMYAFQTLGKLGDTRAIEPIMAVLRNVKLHDIHYMAIHALHDIGKPAVKPLLEALKITENKERVQIADALNYLGKDCAIEDLLAVFNDSDSRVCRSIAAATSKLGAPAVEPLIAVMNNKEHNGREHATHVLGVLKDSSAVQPLIEALKDENPRVRDNAAISLRMLIDLRAVKPLIKSLKDTQSNVRHNAAISLGYLGDSRAVLPLIKALSDKDNNVRIGAAYALSLLGDPRAIKPLIAALSNKDTHVLVMIALTLAKLGDSTGISVLLSTLRLNRMYISYAHQGIVALGEAAVLPLIMELNNKDGRVREDAADFLAEIGDKRALEPLKEQLSKETNIGCIKAIQVAIEEITQQ